MQTLRPTRSQVGEQAVAQALAGGYNLVVASFEEGTVRGLDLAAAFHSTPSRRDMPIILMSSDDNPEHRRRAGEIGVQASIRKGSLAEQRLAETAGELMARKEARGGGSSANHRPARARQIEGFQVKVGLPRLGVVRAACRDRGARRYDRGADIAELATPRRPFGSERPF
jgi:CheY-like chemotaxis protein